MNITRKFSVVRGDLHPVRREIGHRSSDDVWPEVLSHPDEELDRVARENSPGHVFLEIFMVLAIAGLVAVVAVQWSQMAS